MSKTGSNLLFLAVGAALGAAVGYIAASDRKDELLQEIGRFADKVKENIKSATEKGKGEVDELVVKGKSNLKGAIQKGREKLDQLEGALDE